MLLSAKGNMPFRSFLVETSIAVLTMNVVWNESRERMKYEWEDEINGRMTFHPWPGLMEGGGGGGRGPPLSMAFCTPFAARIALMKSACWARQLVFFTLCGWMRVERGGIFSEDKQMIVHERYPQVTCCYLGKRGNWGGNNDYQRDQRGSEEQLPGACWLSIGGL